MSAAHEPILDESDAVVRPAQSAQPPQSHPRAGSWAVAIAVLLLEAAWLLGVAYVVWRLVAAAT